MEPLATRYPIGDSVTMASHFLYGIPFPFPSTSTHPNHGCTLCSDCLIPGGLVFDYVTEVWDPPDTINLGMMCSARVISRSHCTEFTSLGMEGLGKTAISGSQSLKNIDINIYYSGPLVNSEEIDGFPFRGLGIECYYMMIRR